eukprot:CAMPEP_0172201030 /NCGR_PEP_ID=MMETSP1050-20130122/29725_1 /TAXON_ID=233186 /ORGANISM="Cryptomonas curvata, Strain CCAP979/52" /LENGTH=80 /DNA_ID=CAMNT_0012878535 /DNA_START=468 /DNA_END=710 /DNA_ORIENTATION=+
MHRPRGGGALGGRGHPSFTQNWSFELLGGSDASGVALTGSPHVGALSNHTGPPVLVLGRPTAQPPGPDHLAPLPPSGLRG